MRSKEASQKRRQFVDLCCDLEARRVLTTPTKWNSSGDMRHSRATGQSAYAIKDITPGRMERIAELTNGADARPCLVEVL